MNRHGCDVLLRGSAAQGGGQDEDWVHGGSG